MKRIELPVAGKTYPLCFSLRVVQSIGEKFGGVEQMDTALTGGGDALTALKNCVWMLVQMLEAGARYDRGNGAEPAPPPDEDDLLDLFGLDDLADLKGSLMAAIAAGKERTVEAEPGKNAEHTGAETAP